jgi:hypothetical protein
MVNGMIVDGLGHVTLESAPVLSPVNIQPQINQGIEIDKSIIYV